VDFVDFDFKARSTLATMSKQHCQSNIRLCRKDEISTQNSFDIVAVFGNKVERCFDIVAKKKQQCRSNIRHCSIRQCCFDIVAGVDRALRRPSLDSEKLKRKDVRASGPDPTIVSNTASTFVNPALNINRLNPND